MKTQSLIVLSSLLFGCADPYKVPAGRVDSIPRTDPPPLIRYNDSPNDTLSDGAPVELKINLKAIEVKSSGQWFTLVGLEEKARAILTQKYDDFAKSGPFILNVRVEADRTKQYYSLYYYQFKPNTRFWLVTFDERGRANGHLSGLSH